MSETIETNKEFTPEDHYQRGQALMGSGHAPDGLEHLSRAYLSDPQNACYRSAYAVALALVRQQFTEAVGLARGAIRQEFYNPELYLNLARIYLVFDFKAEAIRFLKRGLMVDPDSSTLQDSLAELGIRRRPPLRFLPRTHAANRFLGRMQARLVA